MSLETVSQDTVDGTMVTSSVPCHSSPFTRPLMSSCLFVVAAVRLEPPLTRTLRLIFMAAG